MSKKFLSTLKFVIGWPLSIVALLFILKIITPNINLISKNLFHINFLFILISIPCFIAYFFLRTLLWKKIVDEKGNKSTFKEISYLWAFSELKRYVPGNIWSLLARGTSTLENGLEKKDVANSLILEVELIILGCFILSLPFIFYFSSGLFFSFISLLFAVALILTFIFGAKFVKGKLLVLFPGSNYFKNMELFLLSLPTFLMFGLGVFFAAVSLFYLDPKNVLVIVSLSVFSLLAGYVSLITPMGLGVREGVMTLYLTRFILTPSAALISIFSRIVLIISEIIFLTLVFTWNKIRSNFLNKIEYYILNHKYEICLILFVLIYIAYFTIASFLRYNNFFTGRFDLGNMDQAVWNTIHGRIFQITDPNGTDIISRLSFHADFILILISPLYLIWSNPQMLLLLQSVVLGLGAIFVFAISKLILRNKGLALTFAFVYLLNPALQYSNLYDFHPVVLGTTLLLATFYFFLKKKYLFFLIFAILAGLTKEEIWAIISLFGLAIAIRSLVTNKLKLNKQNAFEIIFGIVIFFVSAFIGYFLIEKLIPLVRGSGHFALSYYSDFGNSASDIFKNVLLSPLKTASTVLQPTKLLFLFQLLLPLGLLSLLSPLALIFAVPDLAIDLLSNNPQLHQIYYQYTAAITPFLLISAIYAVNFLIKRFSKIKITLIVIYLVVFSLLSAYAFGPLPGAMHADIDMFNKQLSYGSVINDFISQIPTRYSIAATNNIGSHLSRRQKIFTIPVGIDQADVILFLLNDSYAQPSLKVQKEMAKEMKKDKNYIEVFEQGDFVAFEKRNLYTDINSKPKKGQVSLFPYSITALSNRNYQKSDITIEKQVPASGNFRSFIVSFISDGLKEYALMNIPNANKPANGFPVLILDHGYIQPNTYDTVNSYKSESDYFANQGFLVLKPDYRGNGNSEIVDTALMRFAYPIDVLNLIASTENISDANVNKIFLWSHSMGGEVTLEVLEALSKNESLSEKIKGAIFWAPVTDPVTWFSRSHLPTLPEAIVTPYPYSQTFQILGTPEANPELWQSLSPLNYLNDINAPILLQHGESDTTVLYQRSVELNNDLLKLKKPINFISYPNDTHNLPLHWSQAVLDDANFLKSLN
jgi:uncharacterized membrane protein/fermentation-respiration switch protein FrsA (DUF1100 family)